MELQVQVEEYPRMQQEQKRESDGSGRNENPQISRSSSALCFSLEGAHLKVKIAARWRQIKKRQRESGMTD